MPVVWLDDDEEASREPEASSHSSAVCAHERWIYPLRRFIVPSNAKPPGAGGVQGELSVA